MGLTERYTHLIIRYKWLVFAVSFLLMMMVASGGRFIGFSNNYRIFFGKDNPDLQAFEALQNTYTKNDNVLLVLAPKDGTIYSKNVFAAVQSITKDGWQVPFSSRVDSLSNYQYSRANEDELIVSDLIEKPEELSQERIAKIKAVVQKEPLLINRLVSPTGDVTAINITVELPGKDPTEVLQVADHVRTEVSKYRKAYPQIDFYASGVVMLNEAFASAAQKDMATLTPVMYLVILLMLAVLLRSVSGTFATLFVICFSVLAGMGFAGWAGIKLSPPSSIAPTVILTLAVADSVHILLNMLTLMRSGRSKNEALIESLRINMQPVFLTSLTTAIGFLSLNFSDQPPYHHLGNITAVGVGFAFLFSVFLLPALIAIFPFRVKVVEKRDKKRLSGFADWIVKNSRSVFFTTLFVILGLTAFVPQIELNDEFVNYFDKTTSFRSDTDYIMKKLTGIYQIEFSLPAKDSGGINSPEYLQTLERFADWFREDPRVVHVNTLTDTMKRLNKNMHADNEEWYRVPGSRELAAQYLLLYEMSLPYGLDLNNQIDVDKSATRFTVTLKNVSARDMRELAELGEKWLQENAPAYMKGTIASGPSLMFSKISKRNVRSMTRGFVLALALITILLIIALKSFGFGLLSLIPNIVPICMSMGLWALIEGQAGTAISIVASVTLGIVVDDTIHFLSKFVRAKREKGLSVQDSIRYSFETVGPALIVTSVVLILGFCVLLGSTFRLNWTLGFLSAATLALALFADFVFLPSMMNLFLKERKS